MTTFKYLGMVGDVATSLLLVLLFVIKVHVGLSLLAIDPKEKGNAD